MKAVIAHALMLQLWGNYQVFTW